MYRFRYFIYKINFIQLLIGALIIFFTALSLIFQFKPIVIWATPIFWTGYIILLNGILSQVKGNSLITNLKWRFLYLLLISYIAWMCFEWLNIFISSWQYKNVTPSYLIRHIGYLWSFATIFPAIIMTFELIYHYNFFNDIHIRRIKINVSTILIIFFLGLLLLFLPIIAFSIRFLDRSADQVLFILIKYIFPLNSEKYLAFAVWTGLILLLDPFNYLMGNWSIIAEIKRGKLDVIINIMLAGFICGLLWEIMNFWAHTKWIYTFPILESVKLFEMPILGYLGFPFFAVEIFEIYQLFFGRRYYLP